MDANLVINMEKSVIGGQGFSKSGDSSVTLGNGDGATVSIMSLVGDGAQFGAYRKYLVERATLFLAYKADEYDNLGFVLTHKRGIYPDSEIFVSDDEKNYHFKFGNIDTSYADMKEVVRYYDLGIDSIVEALIEHVRGVVPITPFGFMRLFDNSGISTLEITDIKKKVIIKDDEYVIKEGYYGEIYRQIEVLVDKTNETSDVMTYKYYHYDEDAYILSLVIQAICCMEIGHGYLSVSVHPEKKIRRVASDTPFAVSISSLARSVYWFFKECKKYILVPGMNTNIQLDVIYAIVMEHKLQLLAEFRQSIVNVRLSLTLCGHRLIAGEDPAARVGIRVNECLKLKKIGRKDPEIISKDYLVNFGACTDRSFKDEITRFLQKVEMKREDVLVIEGDASRKIFDELLSIGFDGNGARKIIPLESARDIYLPNGWETRRFDYWETIIGPLVGRLIFISTSHIGISDLYRRYKDMFSSLESFMKDCEIFFVSDGCVDIEELAFYGFKLKKRQFSVYPLNYWGDRTLISSFVIRRMKEDGYDINFKDVAARIDRFVHAQHVEFLYRYLSYINYATCEIGFMMTNPRSIGKLGCGAKVVWRCGVYDYEVSSPVQKDEEEKSVMTIDYG